MDQSQQEMIDLLEKLLDHAVEGRLKGLAVVTCINGQNTDGAAEWHLVGAFTVLSALGALRELHSNLVNLGVSALATHHKMTVN